MKWLKAKNVNQLAYFSDLIFSSLGVELFFFEPLIVKLIQPENLSLWRLNDEVTNPQWAYSGLKFMLREGALLFAGQEAAVNFEELIEAGLNPEDKDRYHLGWSSYYPEPLVDYLLTEPGSLTHVEFLTYLMNIKDEWLDHSDIMKRVGIGARTRSHFESFIYHSFLNLDNWRHKGIFDLVNITHAFFAGYVPKNADDPGQAFSPNPAHVFASHTNNKSILNHVTYILTTAQPILLRSFFERFALDYVLLGDQVIPMTDDDISELKDLLQLYGKLKIKSEYIEKLSSLILQNSKASAEIKNLAGQYLLRIDRNKYVYVENLMVTLKPSLKRIHVNRYSQGVTIVEANFDPNQDYGTQVHSVSPDDLQDGSNSCQMFLSR
jgi:hypothetical protein